MDIAKDIFTTLVASTRAMLTQKPLTLVKWKSSSRNITAQSLTSLPAKKL